MWSKKSLKMKATLSTTSASKYGSHHYFFEINNFCNVLPCISSRTQSIISLHLLILCSLIILVIYCLVEKFYGLYVQSTVCVQWLTFYWNNPLQISNKKNIIKIYWLEWYRPYFLAEKYRRFKKKKIPNGSVAITFWEAQEKIKMHTIRKQS